MSQRTEIRKLLRKNPGYLSHKKFQKGQRCLIYSKTSYNLCHIVGIRWHGNKVYYKVNYKKSLLEKAFGSEYMLPYLPNWRYWLMVYKDIFVEKRQLLISKYINKK